MPFIPHTENEISSMLESIGVKQIDDLFSEVPAELRAAELLKIPTGLSEMQMTQLMTERGAQDGRPLCFIGAGAYDHYVPAAVWQITTRGEFYTAYTPYQAEASQGTLQLIYEFQSMMTTLTAMDVSNASVYDGASSVAEAVLMAVRANRKSKSKRILVPRNINPSYAAATHTLVNGQNIELVDIDYDKDSGCINLDALKAFEGEDFAAVVIQQPNFFGSLEDVDAITDWAHANNALLIAVVNPLAMSILKPAGEWGEAGADIACGDGQPLGAPLSSGGPYYGIMCCKKALVRQMPGRIVGRTLDEDGKEGFVLTLQAREQHIRRSKATSNICTNQGLVVTASTIHMSILGAAGLENAAIQSHLNTRSLVEKICALDGAERMFDSASFHETVIKLNKPARAVLDAMTESNIIAGFDLAEDYPELGNAILVCATEQRTEKEIDLYVSALAQALSEV
ncbi:MAG: aminomethyl-transferring glycine dehydrogenase subunit GcvPA [Gammaproteobacteria bacterium]|nr:aminomethyl-transferring glycine dehydrogenase subunit GcvPA [Gammaproteobacteria bacterium]